MTINSFRVQKEDNQQKLCTVHISNRVSAVAMFTPFCKKKLPEFCLLFVLRPPGPSRLHADANFPTCGRVLCGYVSRLVSDYFALWMFPYTQRVSWLQLRGKKQKRRKRCKSIAQRPFIFKNCTTNLWLLVGRVFNLKLFSFVSSRLFSLASHIISRLGDGGGGGARCVTHPSPQRI